MRPALFAFREHVGTWFDSEGAGRNWRNHARLGPSKERGALAA
ncbi:MAG TPA: hypothetical protein VK524_18310 [Polyangiaceae bacterium]|nr:hypothetical protein [Polyangiaceae bacterium]